MGQGTLLQRSRQRIYFRNEDMDYYLAWMLSYEREGGATIGECFEAASQIKDGDPDSWVRAWVKLAERVEAQAAKALRNGRRVSAREAHLRACTYYRASLFGLHIYDPCLSESRKAMRCCFRQAAALFDTPIETIEIPFEGKSLPGYFMSVDDSHKQRPTLIMVGGGESYVEELYFWIGPAGVRRGYNVLLVDLPGQGSAPDDGLFFRVDYETPVGAVVDYVLQRPEVDADRLALYGISRGGYMVSRAVTQERRIKACIANAPIIDVYRKSTESIPPALKNASAPILDAVIKLRGRQNPFSAIFMENFCWQAGVSKVSEALELVRQAKVEQISQIGCPVLCLVGTGESEEQMTQARSFYDALTTPKMLRVFTAADGADAHCQINNLSLMQQTVFDWLDEIFE